ncbi:MULTISPECIES: MFS transporter [Clostridia]|uniref:MFS transporter n=1 Tax=Clostridia TaxID=186801 RepID=UPI00067F5026|nr:MULTISPECIES: glycoside-pentoside-hexuronide (GPH):cation symporter [Clostridia]
MSKQKTGSLPMWKKIAYGLGNAGGGFTWGTITTFLLLYCTNVIGVSAAIIGTLLMFAKVFDGITDIFMGRIIDLTKSKMGKTRFWYLMSCIPMGVCMFLIFNVPGSLGEGAKSAWIFIFYLLISAVFYTMNQVAYNMMLARVTKDQHDQVTMSGAAMLSGTIGSVVVASVTSGLVEAFGGGQQGWRMIALIYAVVGVGILLIPFFTLKELPEEEFDSSVRESDTEAPAKTATISFGRTIIELFQNKYFILILLLYFVGYANSGIMQSSMAYYATYSMGNAGLMGILGMCTTIPLILGLPFMPKFIDKLGMRRACVYGAVLSVAGCIVAVFGQFTGMIILIAGLLIKALGMVPGSATYTPFLVKADEFHYQKKGHRVTGSLFSCATVGTKIGQGLGTAICGWILTWSGFDGTAAVQTAAANNAINFLYLGFPFIFSIITAIIYANMKVEEEIR